MQAMEKQKNIEIEVKSANVEEGNASAILTETDGKVAFDKGKGKKKIDFFRK